MCATCLQEVAEAYEVLTDAEKRRVYDQMGEAGLKNPGGHGGPGGPGGGHHFHFQVGGPLCAHFLGLAFCWAYFLAGWPLCWGHTSARSLLTHP